MVPGLGRCPGGGHGNPTPVLLPEESSWTEEHGGLQSMGLQESGMIERLKHSTQQCLKIVNLSGSRCRFLSGSDGKESPYNAGDPGSIPGLGKSPGGGNGDPLKCSCLENSKDRGAWVLTVLGFTESQTGLSD